MEIRINLKKMHFFFIIGAIFLVSFVLAQTAPNPGHSSGQVDMGGQTLVSWASNKDSQISQLESRVSNTESSINLLWAGLNCPLGMFEVGASPGIRGSYCISSLPVGTSNWASAVQQCTSSGTYLCNAAELVGACLHSGYSSSTQFGWGTAHWAADLDTGFSALVVGAGSCTTINAGNLASTTYQHRCCKNLVGNV